MLIKPIQLGQNSLEREAMLADRKACRRFGPCGVGEKALYLNSFYVDCRYYLPFDGVTRVFKRVAMSKGGFTGKGSFASIPYLVAEYDGGQQKQCNFKREEQVDQLLAYLAEKRPDLPRMSKEAEERLAQRARELAARPHPPLTDTAQRTLRKLEDSQEYLDRAPQLTLELSQASRRKRAFLQSNPAYRWTAMALTAIGAAAVVLGLISFFQGNRDFSIYIALLGFAVLFLFSGFSVLPTAKNNRRAILGRADKALAGVENYLRDYPNFPVPPRYAHPVVLQRMIRAVEEGRAQKPEDALETVKTELKSLNRDVQVSQEEYDEVVSIKALFLNEDYR